MTEDTPKKIASVESPGEPLTFPDNWKDMSPKPGTAFTFIGAEAFRPTRPRPPAGSRDVTSRGLGHTFVGAEALRRNATIGKTNK